MSANPYGWTDGDGDDLAITASGALCVTANTDEGQEAVVYLPTEPEDVEALVRAILTATGCRFVHYSHSRAPGRAGVHVERDPKAVP